MSFIRLSHTEEERSGQAFRSTNLSPSAAIKEILENLISKFVLFLKQSSPSKIWITHYF